MIYLCNHAEVRMLVSYHVIKYNIKAMTYHIEKLHKTIQS